MQRPQRSEDERCGHRQAVEDDQPARKTTPVNSPLNRSTYTDHLTGSRCTVSDTAASDTLDVALGLLPLLTEFIVVGTSLTRALKTQPRHHGRPASAGSTR